MRALQDLFLPVRNFGVAPVVVRALLKRGENRRHERDGKGPTSETLNPMNECICYRVTPQFAAAQSITAPKGVEKASFREIVVQEGMFGESVSASGEPMSPLACDEVKKCRCPFSCVGPPLLHMAASPRAFGATAQLCESRLPPHSSS